MKNRWKSVLGFCCTAVLLLGLGEKAEAQTANLLNYSWSIPSEAWSISSYVPSAEEEQYKDIIGAPNYFEGSIKDVFYSGPVIGIDPSVFKDHKFQYMEFANENLVVIGENAFENVEVCDKGYKGAYDGSIIFHGDVGRIGAYAFHNIKIDGRLVFEGKIDTIQDYAMSGMNLGEGLISEEIRMIGKGAFANNTVVNWPKVKNLEEVGDYAFDSCTKLEYFEFGDTVTSIGTGCFRGCTSLKTVILPNNSDVTIGENAFPNQEGLTIVIPSEITNINNYYFELLTNVVFQVEINCPEIIIQYFNEHGLHYKEGETGEIQTGTPDTGEDDKGGNTGGTTGDDNNGGQTGGNGDNVGDIIGDNDNGEQTGGNSDNTGDITGGNGNGGQAGGNGNTGNQEGITEGDNTSGNTPATETEKETPVQGKTYTYKDLQYKVTGDSTVTFMQPSNKKIKNLTIPATVKILGKNLKVTKINAKACYNCKQLTSVTVGNNVEVVGDQAFAKCTKLKKITFGKELKKLGKKTFYQDKNLNQITIKSTKLKSIGKGTLKGVKKVSVKAPKKKVKAYQELFRKAK